MVSSPEGGHVHFQRLKVVFSRIQISQALWYFSCHDMSASGQIITSVKYKLLFKSTYSAMFVSLQAEFALIFSLFSTDQLVSNVICSIHVECYFSLECQHSITGRVMYNVLCW